MKPPDTTCISLFPAPTKLTWTDAKARAGEILRGLRVGLSDRDVRLVLRALSREFQRSKTMSPETYRVKFGDHQILCVLDHASAVDLLESTGLTIPAIPPGKNTIQLFSQDALGRAMLFVNQTGFVQERSDDEQQINGLSCYILQTLPVPINAADILQSFVHHMENS